MPWAEPARPRKILPPPTTMHISVPAACASATSRAIRSTTSILMPKLSSPINASPETLSRTRRYFGAGGMGTSLSIRGLCRLTGARHLGDFVGEIGVGLLDALAHLEADKAFHRDGSADVLGGLFDHLADLGLAIDHEGLLQQHRLFVEFAHAPFHHLLDDILGAARLAGDLGLDIAPPPRHSRGQMLRRDGKRGSGSHMHGELLGQRQQLVLVAGRLETYQHADL